MAAMADLRGLLHKTAERIADHRIAVLDRSVVPTAAVADLRAGLGGPMPRRATPAADVLERLATIAEPGTVATTGPRFFGFVIGGALDAATCADLLAIGWDQPAFNATTSPAAAAAEDVVGRVVAGAAGHPEYRVVRAHHGRAGREHRRARGGSV